MYLGDNPGKHWYREKMWMYSGIYFWKKLDTFALEEILNILPRIEHDRCGTLQIEHEG